MVALALALLAAGCSASMPSASLVAPSAGATEAPRSDAGSGPTNEIFTGSTAKGVQTAANAEPDINCPAVEIRRGAATLTIAPPGERSAMTLKYQGSFIRAARECTVAEGNMIMKIGIEGRVVIGPGGGPGRVDVPLRFAVVQETPTGMRPIATKFVIVPVEVQATGNTLFSHVEEGMTFPIPTPAAVLDDYIVYVGFDPLSAEAQTKGPPKVRPKSKKQPGAAN